MLDDCLAMHYGQRGVETRDVSRHGPQLLQAVRPMARLVQNPRAAAGFQAGNLIAADHDRAGVPLSHGSSLGPCQPCRPLRGRFARQIVFAHAGGLTGEREPQPAQQGLAVRGGGGQQQGRKSGHGPD